MEGYFRADEYAKLEGIPYMTAMKRVNRNRVDFFKEPRTGNVYIYWSEESKLIPDDFIPLQIFAKNMHASSTRVYRWIRDGRINESNIYKKYVGRKLHYYIKKDAALVITEVKNNRIIVEEEK